jgi:hypothetical protein
VPASSRQAMHWFVENAANALPLSIALMSTLKMLGLARTCSMTLGRSSSLSTSICTRSLTPSFISFESITLITDGYISTTSVIQWSGIANDTTASIIYIGHRDAF